MRRKQNKAPWSRPLRPMLLLIPTLLAATLLVGMSTFAWFISNDGKRNDLASGNHRLRIEVVDDFTPPVDPDPGDTFPKTVGAKNTGNLPGFVRLLVEATIFADDDSYATPLPARFGDEVLLPDLNTTDWTLGEDGYYYYLHVLQPGQTAPPLFTQVELDSALDSRYQNAQMKIEVKCEGVDYYSYRVGLATRYHFRDAFWADPTSAPPVTQPDLRDIDALYRGFAK